MTSVEERLAYTIVRRASAERSRRSAASAMIGVIPEPAAIATTCPVEVDAFDTKVPAGLMTSTSSPGRSPSCAQVEKRPSGSRLMPTLIAPRRGGLHSEYERRSSSPSTVARRATYCPGA